VKISRFSYSFPGSGTLTIQQGFNAPMILLMVAATVSAVGGAPSGDLSLLNGEGIAAWKKSITGVTLSPLPATIVFSENSDIANAAVGGSTRQDGGVIPPDLLVMPGETVELTLANVTVDSVVVTWREP